MKIFLEKPKVIVICGPTAVGKTSEAIRLAEMFDGEIISADSRQIYRYLDIGTAKPTPGEQAQIPHHLIDIAEPGENFDAKAFAETAHNVVDDLLSRGRLPFIVGGTGLYIKSFLYGLFSSRPSGPELRRELKALAETHGTLFLYERLKQNDPQTAGRLHPNDTYRIIRALEVFGFTGKPMSDFHREHGFARENFSSFKIGLYLNRSDLYEQIDRRVDKMVNDGILKEVRDLLERGFFPESNAMRSIGYRHMIDYLFGKISWEEAIRTFKRDTRRYAKRQLTWFGSDPEIIWVKPGETAGLVPEIRGFLENGMIKIS